MKSNDNDSSNNFFIKLYFLVNTIRMHKGKYKKIIPEITEKKTTIQFQPYFLILLLFTIPFSLFPISYSLFPFPCHVPLSSILNSIILSI